MASMIISAKGRRFLDMNGLASRFANTIPAIEEAAAKQATVVSRATFNTNLNVRGRPYAPLRAGRPTTMGHFASDIIWALEGKGLIGIDLTQLERYALILEIGTGESAKILNPPGELFIPKQYGREISAKLFWASGKRTPAKKAEGGVSGDQLFYASDLSTTKNVSPRKKHIHKEIEGKHFLQAGGRAGYLELSQGLVDEAKRIFQ